MNANLKPLLAVQVENFDTLTFPKLASPKLDGIRCLTVAGQAVSRNLKPIPNAHVRAALAALQLPELDGELVTYTDGVIDPFNVVSSKIMSRDGTPDFKFQVFDDFSVPAVGFAARLGKAGMTVGSRNATGDRHLELVEHLTMRNQSELDAYEAKCLTAGYEGVMLRDPQGPYKFGRSTEREAILLKVKRFVDDEATVTGVEELMHNGNEATTDALGHTVRSSHKANMVGRGMLGALVCRTSAGLEFKIGTGFSEATRRELWPQDLVGKLVKFRHQASGAKEAPRFPSFIGFRDAGDL